MITMKKRKYKIFMGDFETTVYNDQEHTEVWASAVVELYTEDVKIFHSISDTFEYLKSLKENIVIYYHNLKFDGNFWISYLMEQLNFKQAYEVLKDDPLQVKWLPEKDMKCSPLDNGTYQVLLGLTPNLQGFFYNVLIYLSK